MMNKYFYIFIFFNVILSMNSLHADDSFEVNFFPYRNYTMKSILSEKEISQVDFDKFRIILTEISNVQSAGEQIDYNLINNICISNKLTYKRFFYIYCKQPVCFYEPYSDVVAGDLVFSCTENEILLSHANKDIFQIKGSILERLLQTK